jgi:6-phosphofructokinase 1
MRFGVLTGGGDCPGLNAVIRSVARRSLDRGHEVMGVRAGWRGLVDGRFEELDHRAISGILPRGGTIVGTSRTNPYKVDGGVERVRENFARERLDALVAIGGEDTLGVASRLHEEHGFPVVGVPKTIDNDLSATDYTFGFDTAVFIATEAIDRLHTTAESHNRVMVVEVMGRHTGWIAIMSAIAGGADATIVPEFETDPQELLDLLNESYEKGKPRFTVVVAEGASPSAQEFCEFVNEAGGSYQADLTTLGHIQSGGTPTAFDRILAARLGAAAVDALADDASGVMVGISGEEIHHVPLEEIAGEKRQLDPGLYRLAGVLSALPEG